MRSMSVGVLALLFTAVTPVQAELPPDIQTENSIRTQSKLISTAATGPPLEVTSTALVSNLNADRLDGMDSADFATATQVSSIFNQGYFNSSETFVVPTGVTVLNVTVIGGGGGGGSAGDEGGGGTGYYGGGGGTGGGIGQPQLVPGTNGFQPGAEGAGGGAAAAGGADRAGAVLVQWVRPQLTPI